MESAASLQTWKAFQGKLRSCGANSVYSAREMLVQEYVNQQRMKHPDVSGGVHELSPKHAPIDSPSDNISSYSLSHSRPSDQELPIQQGRRPISISRPDGTKRVDRPNQETGDCNSAGFRSFVDDVVGRAQPESEGPGRGLPHDSPSFSFDGFFFVRPSTTRRRSMDSDPFPVPTSRGTMSSDRIESLNGDQGYHSRDTVNTTSSSSLGSTSERPSLISILSEKWTRSNQEAIAVDEMVKTENSRTVLPRPTRRLSEPFSLHSRFNDACANPHTSNSTLGSSQRTLPNSVGSLLVDFPATKRTKSSGDPRIPPSKLLVDFPTTTQKQSRRQGVKEQRKLQSKTV